jgi:hypothetical protein
MPSGIMLTIIHYFRYFSAIHQNQFNRTLSFMDETASLISLKPWGWHPAKSVGACTTSLFEPGGSPAYSNAGSSGYRQQLLFFHQRSKIARWGPGSFSFYAPNQ